VHNRAHHASIFNRKLVGSLAFISVLMMPIAAAAQAPQAPAKAAAPSLPAPAQAQLPPPEAMIILIRSSIVALSQANVTNNYTVLNALGSREFRASNSPVQLANVFQSFRTNKIDLSPIVYVNPQLTVPPTLVNRRLRLVGNFPTKPMQVNFDLTFEPDDGLWKLFGLGVNLSNTPTPPNH